MAPEHFADTRIVIADDIYHRYRRACRVYEWADKFSLARARARFANTAHGRSLRPGLIDAKLKVAAIDEFRFELAGPQRFT